MHRFALIFIFFIQTIYAQPPRLMLPIGHNDAIKDFAFSKNGKFIVTGSEDRTVKVWEVNTGRLLQNFTNFNAKVQSVDFNPNNKTVIACSDDGFFYEWDIYTGKIITALKNENEMIYLENLENIIVVSDFLKKKKIAAKPQTTQAERIRVFAAE